MASASTRKLRSLLHLLRSEGVAEYTDGTVTVKFAPPKPAPLAAQGPAPDEAKPDAETMHAQRLRALMGGLFNTDGEVG